MTVLRGDTEVEGWAIFRRVPVHGSKEGGGLIQFYDLKIMEHIM